MGYVTQEGLTYMDGQARILEISECSSKVLHLLGCRMQASTISSYVSRHGRMSGLEVLTS